MRKLNRKAMKHNHNHHTVKSNPPQLVPVRFDFTNPTATSVCIAGTFNNWKPEGKAVHSTGDGHWWEDTALAPGTYEYCLVVDGKYIPDPLAKETVPNPFGGRNSVLTVFSSAAAEHLIEAETFPLKNANKPSSKRK
jgi:1,4-alpha-glucan branching enzyme